MDDKNLELIIRSETLYDGMSTLCYNDQVQLVGMLAALCAVTHGVKVPTANIIADEIEMFLKTNINGHTEGIKHSMFEPPSEN